MTNEPINTPSLAGLAIAGGVGLVGFAVSLLLIDLGGNGSVMVGAVLALVVALILGFPATPVPAPARPAAAHVPAPVAAPVAAPAPDLAPEPAPEPAPVPQVKPAALEAARDGKADDLQQIKGIGPKLEEMLNGMGIYHFDQIAAWQAAELAWVDDNLEGFKGRASRDEWVAQARSLAAGGG